MPVMSTLKKPSHQQRSWGTRFDSLMTSPRPSQLAAASTASSDVESEDGVVAPTTEGKEATADNPSPDSIFEGDAFKTSWADDEVPETPSTPASYSATASPSYRSSRVKMPHNASVFIGSLPKGMEEAELKQSLLEHLSQFAKVHKVKLVHDHQKGYLSAFVQCEDADQATQLIAKSPGPFQGHILRYESARAHRSLYLSYKQPRTFVPADKAEDANNDGGEGVWVEGKMPEHMHLVLQPEFKRAVIRYDDEARKITGKNLNVEPPYSATLEELGDNGRLFLDIQPNEKMMRDIAASFGALEYFQPYDPIGDEPRTPAGHDILRSAGMDERVWEVKWEHRDDCITALNTLKTVPHICASWAVQPAKERAFPSPSPFFNRTNAERSPIARELGPFQKAQEKKSPKYRILKSPRHAPLSPGTEVEFPSLSPRHSRKSFSKFNQSIAARSPRLENADADDTFPGKGLDSTGLSSEDSARTLTSDNSSSGVLLDGFDGILSKLSLKEEMSPTTKQGFPLRDAFDGSRCAGDLSTEPRGEIDIPSNHDEDATVAIDPEVQKARNDVKEAPKQISPSRPPIFHRRSLSLSTPGPRIDTSLAVTHDIPTTPELSGATYSPESPLSAVPRTPLYAGSGPLPSDLKETVCTATGIQDRASDSREDGHVRTSTICHDSNGERREVDPKTIFVGGLEAVGAEDWDEGRLRGIFGRYGTIEHVKYVRQNVKKAAFAFITYSDETAPPKAIAAEHNRAYGGRAIRVQIRDIYPIRNGFKFRPRVQHRPRPFGQYMDFDPAGKGELSNGGAYHSAGRGPAPGRNFPFTAHVDRRSGSFANGGPPSTHVPPFVVIPRLMNHRESSLGDSESFPSSQSMADSAHSAESDVRTAVSVTPPPSNNASNATMPTPTVVPFSPQSAGPSPMAYYHPHAWPSPYGPSVYPIPVGAYGPGFPQVPFQYGPVPNAAGAALPQPFQWAPPAIPYHYVPMVPSEAPCAPTMLAPETPENSSVKAPLNATGFVQGEYGGLIPIYGQEALNQYMAGQLAGRNSQMGAGGPSNDSLSCTSPIGPPSHASGVVSPSNGFWPGGPAQGTLYAYSAPPNALSAAASPIRALPPQAYENTPVAKSPVGPPLGPPIANPSTMIHNHRHMRPPLDLGSDQGLSKSKNSSHLMGPMGQDFQPPVTSHFSQGGPSDRNFHPRRGTAIRIDTGFSASSHQTHLRSPARLDLDRHGNPRHFSTSGINEAPVHHQSSLNVRQQGNILHNNQGQQ